MSDMCGPEPRLPAFDWFTDDAVVIRGQLAVAAYLNQDGDLVLRREAHPFCDECDSVIVIASHYVPAVAAAMLELVGSKDASSGAFTHDTTIRRIDPTNAERQRRHRRNRNGTVTLRNVTADGAKNTADGANSTTPNTDTETETRPAGEAERAFDFHGGTRPAEDG